jgi:hypothetical protein
MKNIFLLTVFFVASMTSFAGADILSLKSGHYFEGEIIKIKSSCEVVFKSEGHRFIIPVDDIAYIQFNSVNDRVYRKYLELEADPAACMKGQMDASMHHGKKGGHVLLGALFGPFAMLGTLVANPTPDKGKSTYMLSENKDLFSDYQYIECYKKSARKSLIGMEAVGWGVWILLIVL